MTHPPDTIEYEGRAWAEEPPKGQISQLVHLPRAEYEVVDWQPADRSVGIMEDTLVAYSEEYGTVILDNRVLEDMRDEARADRLADDY